MIMIMIIIISIIMTLFLVGDPGFTFRSSLSTTTAIVQCCPWEIFDSIWSVGTSLDLSSINVEICLNRVHDR